MAVALNDARAVVLRARNHRRRRVVLGGHSLGASLTVAYAAWDFNGRPGYKDLEGLVLMDGGLLGSFTGYDLSQAQQAIADLQTSSPFLDLLGIGIPEAAGLFAEIGGLYAEQAPTAPATTLQSYPLLPAEFNPPFPVTNRGLFGYAFDRDTSPAVPRTPSHQRRRTGCLRRSARLGRRRRHAGEPTGPDVRAGAEQRGRVVLPEPADDRHQRRGSDECERRRQLPRPAPLPHSQGEPPGLRDRHRSGGRPRHRRGAELHPEGADDQSASRRWSTGTPRSATSTRSPRRPGRTPS